MNVFGFEEDLPPDASVEVACFARGAAEQLTEMCKQRGLQDLVALFVAAEREAARAVKRLGPVADHPIPVRDLGTGPRGQSDTVRFCAELSMQLVLLCERVGLISLSALFYAAWRAARDLSPYDELA